MRTTFASYYGDGPFPTDTVTVPASALAHITHHALRHAGVTTTYLINASGAYEHNLADIEADLTHADSDCVAAIVHCAPDSDYANVILIQR